MRQDRIVRVGHSPDPDDAFMFYGLASGRVKIPGVVIEHVMADIQTLNERALRAELEVTAISAHAFAHVAGQYWIMRTGASMGEGYGPIIVSQTLTPPGQLAGRRIATPGRWTTANLLLKIFHPEMQNVDMPFDRIIAAVQAGEVDAGLLIHEGQINYHHFGLHKLIDYGELWREYAGGLPLPLGLDVVRKDLGAEMAHRLSRGLRDSITYGYQHQEEAIPYALQFGRGIDAKLGERFVKMYVNEVTLDMGARGQRALELLYELAWQRKLIPAKPEVVLY
ncbi:MAG: ABC transporter substrate-binding protein [candidate division KSB1 bacterium]|nr:ABC transporter substrate-binding protein [candidate division KSB1 bacterium]MDZ7275728.1 ABC transporter substrate-binding protein [candidate division KSB1 bacterium]MDZ7284581.1 ABC transporter substrate-binding protein [candidate division KSB1 bacterium]MDZ7298000.1 ABC transporter substrate-binding protein [candidate division KSB1 bacterium]MDZ7305832.1 ABC transporter substrate-binding protein [candidate division KSB1 bacterium]